MRKTIASASRQVRSLLRSSIRTLTPGGTHLPSRSSTTEDPIPHPQSATDTSTALTARHGQAPLSMTVHSATVVDDLARSGTRNKAIDARSSNKRKRGIGNGTPPAVELMQPQRSRLDRPRKVHRYLSSAWSEQHPHDGNRGAIQFIHDADYIWKLGLRPSAAHISFATIQGRRFPDGPYPNRNTRAPPTLRGSSRNRRRPTIPPPNPPTQQQFRRRSCN